MARRLFGHADGPVAGADYRDQPRNTARTTGVRCTIVCGGFVAYHRPVVSWCPVAFGTAFPRILFFLADIPAVSSVLFFLADIPALSRVLFFLANLLALPTLHIILSSCCAIATIFFVFADVSLASRHTQPTDPKSHPDSNPRGTGGCEWPQL
jgi:hypothetical protein